MIFQCVLVDIVVMVMTPPHCSYERASIEAWFATGKTTSPKTGAQLSGLALFPNHDLRARIIAWSERNA